jgi:para-aminobenzoate synthetase component I
MQRASFKIKKCDNYKALLQRAFHSQPFCILNSNDYPGDFKCMIAAGAIDELIASPAQDLFEQLRIFHKKSKDFIVGFLSYDLKNHIEHLSSANPDFTDFPLLYFFQPKYIFSERDNEIEVAFPAAMDEREIREEIEAALSSSIEPREGVGKLKIESRFTDAEYINTVEKIKSHIQRGDIYEMNLCREFFVEDVSLDPYQLYEKLNEASPMPFSCYFHYSGRHLSCASPERYIKIDNKKVISQPIKGTIKRGNTPEEDEALKEKLKNDPKEQSENVMIVDLVRNDLSITAKKASVKVDELFGIYTFPRVHHMISTISSELKEEFDFSDVLKSTFPMGSMTGAPKVRAMQLIDTFEKSARGLFSGAVGYITPEGNADFNVVIRSILYNSEKKYLSFMVGSAITSNSSAENEQKECMLKAKAIFSVLGGHQI